MADLFAGAAVGLLFTVLYEVAKEVKDKNSMFKPLLGDLTSTLELLKPLMEEIEKFNEVLDRRKEELQGIKEQMGNGKELIIKCSKIKRWRIDKKHEYSNKLIDLEKSMNRLLGILNVQAIRDGKETLVEVKGITEGVSRLELSVAILREKKNQIESGGLFAVPEPLTVTVGLDVPLMELKMKLLKDDVSMLVLTAPAGCGKTTLVTKFCQDQEVKDTFKNNILFVTVSRKPNLELIVQELYQHNGSEVPTFRNEVSVVQCLQHFLKEEGKEGENPLLVVLDDVWPGPGSEFLMEKFDQLKMPNYKILVASTSVFPRFGSAYHLQSLSYDHAFELFHHSASLGDRSLHIPKELSRQIVEHCKRLPLALTVVGKALCGKPIEFWLKRVADWSKDSSILDSEAVLRDCLQNSLDSLDENDAIIRECFIDLASFPEDQRIPAAALIDMWAELYKLNEDFLSIMNLHELSARSLANLVVTRDEKIQVVDGYYSEHFVAQHKMLRELAIYHTKLDPLEHRKRLVLDVSGDRQPEWLTEVKSQPIKARLLSIFSDGVFGNNWNNIELPEVEVLVLTFQTKDYALPEFVENIDKLKVLIVTNYGILPAELNNFQLLGSLPRLKRIRLERVSIPSIIKHSVQLKSLKKISLFMCNIGQAFGNCSIQITDTFPSLEEMNIDYCNDLVELPADLCDLIHLKKVSITNCHKLSALPEGFEKLINLEVLRLRSCTDLVQLPDSITRLPKLSTLDISGCFSIKELPEDIGEISTLTKLNMRQCLRLTELPQSVIELEQLQEVICDEDTEYLWEPFQAGFGDKIKVAKESINLNWLQNTPF